MPLPGPVSAQTAAEITPESFRPAPLGPSAVIELSGGPVTQAPPGAERLSIQLDGVVIEGGLQEAGAANEAVRTRLTRGRIPASEIFEAAQALERAYAEAGFALARVVLPAQELRDGGTLRLVVFDGFVERVDDEAVPASIRAPVAAALSPLIGQRGLRLSELERRLLLARAVPGGALSNALATGDQPGGTRLIVEGEYRPVTGFVGIDNSLADELGDWTVSAGVEVNSVLGFGELIYGQVSGQVAGEGGGLFDDEPQQRTVALGVAVPIGADGLSFNLEASRSETAPEVAADEVPTASQFDRISARLTYPFVLGRSTTVLGSVIYDHASDALDITAAGGDLPVYRDELRVLRFSGDVARQFDTGAQIFANATASFGLEAFGARTADDASPDLPLSRDGADAQFSKLSVTARYRMPVAESLSFTLSGRAQTSFGEPLLKSEQFGIANANDLSTFDSGTLTGDSGWVMRAELSRPFEVAAGGMPLTLDPYVFAGAGAVQLHQPTASEEDVVNASAYGIGVRLFANGDSRFRSTSLRAEFGKGLRDDDEPDGTRFSLFGELRF